MNSIDKIDQSNNNIVYKTHPRTNFKVENISENSNSKGVQFNLNKNTSYVTPNQINNFTSKTLTPKNIQTSSFTTSTTSQNGYNNNQYSTNALSQSYSSPEKINNPYNNLKSSVFSCIKINNEKSETENDKNTINLNNSNEVQNQKNYNTYSGNKNYLNNQSHINQSYTNPTNFNTNNNTSFIKNSQNPSNSNINNTKVQDVNSLIEEYTNLRNLNTNYLFEIDNLKAENTKYKIKHKEYEEKIVKIGNIFFNLQENHEVKKMLNNSLTQEINKIKEELSFTQSEKNRLEIQLKNENNSIQELKKINLQKDEEIKNYKNTIINCKEEWAKLSESYENLLIDECNKINLQKDEEIKIYKNTIINCKEEWTKLSDSYENLLNDIRTQIKINENLKNLVLELSLKIEKHNNDVGGMDNMIKHQIDILSNQALAKKGIEMSINKDIIKEADGSRDILSNKLKKIEKERLYKSATFSNLNLNLKENFTYEHLDSSEKVEDYVMAKPNLNQSENILAFNRSFSFGKQNNIYAYNQIGNNSQFNFADKNINEKITQLRKLMPLDKTDIDLLKRKPHILNDALANASQDFRENNNLKDLGYSKNNIDDKYKQNYYRKFTPRFDK